MSCTYENCYKLIGFPVCGNKVTSMFMTYANCYNLTGSPVCGNNVTDMSWTYFGCFNLSAGSIYMRSNNISSAWGCFSGKNNFNRYNIYAHPNTTTWNTLSINNSSSLVGTFITWTNDTTTGGFYNTTYNIYIYPFINISFTIDNTTYQTLIGTTWYNWCKDEGSTLGFTCEFDNGIVTNSSGAVVVNGNVVIGTETITDRLIATIANMDFILQDFDYTANDDGTYTLTNWKQTLNGEPSTKMVIPNYSVIRL
jgi:hypothetical protein